MMYAALIFVGVILGFIIASIIDEIGSVYGEINVIETQDKIDGEISIPSNEYQKLPRKRRLILRIKRNRTENDG